MIASPDYMAVFAAAHHAYLLLDPDLRILDANRAYLGATMSERDALAGRHMFEAFPDNPEDPEADGTRNLGASLERVLGSAEPDAMPRQRYDIRRRDGSFEERFWDPVNTPVVSGDGRIALIIHHVVDVTESMRWRAPHWRARSLPATVKLEDLPAVLTAQELSRETRSAIASSQRLLRDLETSRAVVRSDIENSQRLMAISRALLRRPSG